MTNDFHVGEDGTNDLTFVAKLLNISASEGQKTFFGELDVRPALRFPSYIPDPTAEPVCESYSF